MADEQIMTGPVTVSGVPEGTTQVTLVPAPDPLETELARVSTAAAEFMRNADAEAAEGVAPAAPDKKRGPDGKFISDAPAPAVAPTAHLDTAWVYAAEQEDMTAEQIAAFKSSEELQRHVVDKKIRALKRAGIDYNELQEFRRARATPQPVRQVMDAPIPAAAPAPVAKTFKLDINEDELSPEHVKLFKAIETQVNDSLSVSQNELKQVREQVAAQDRAQRQSAEEWQQAEIARQQAVAWDKAAGVVPGFVEAFGMTPSQLQELSRMNPGDKRVVDFEAWSAYFRPTYTEMVKINGDTEDVFVRAMKESFSASPFSKISRSPGTVNNNGKSSPGVLAPGSVITGSRQRTGELAPLSASTDPMEVERERILEEIGRQWAEAGMNPYLAASQRA